MKQEEAQQEEEDIKAETTEDPVKAEAKEEMKLEEQVGSPDIEQTDEKAELTELADG